MREPSLAVAARDEEHGRSVGGSTADDAGGDADGRAAHGHIAHATADGRAGLDVA